jgi:hypothetical protein
VLEITSDKNYNPSLPGRARVQDATQALPDERFDLIVCRYAVFLYLTREQARG